MITVIDEKGNVAFINESECVSVVYNKEDRTVRACPIQRTADIGLPMNDMKFFDVVSVTYNNEAHPTSQIFKADKPTPPPAEYENDKVMDLYKEIDRIETAEKEQTKKDYPNWSYIQKRGNGVRFMNIAKANGIETVGQLLKFGRDRFEQLRNIGPNCIKEISEALKNLYGIEKW